jgi:hypothetical protein
VILSSDHDNWYRDTSLLQAVCTALQARGRKGLKGKVLLTRKTFLLLAVWDDEFVKKLFNFFFLFIIFITHLLLMTLCQLVGSYFFTQYIFLDFDI